MIPWRRQYLPPHCYPGRKLKPIRCCVIHYVSAIYAAPDRWDDPDTIFTMLIELNLPGEKRGRVLPASNEPRYHASYHCLVARNGTIINTLDRAMVAWHAGESEYNGRSGCNEFSRGVGAIATHDSGFTDAQYHSLAEIGKREVEEGISVFDLVGHDFVAPGRKKDPGPLFDWNRLRTEVQAA